MRLICPAFALALVLFCSCSKPEVNSDHEKSQGKSAAEGATPVIALTPVDVVSKSGIEMVYLPPGEFMMGSNQGNPDEAPMHKVKLTGFLIKMRRIEQRLRRNTTAKTARSAELLSQKGAQPFAPMKGRPMKEYVVLPPTMLEDEETVKQWMRRGLDYARSLPAKKKKKKR